MNEPNKYSLCELKVLIDKNIDLFGKLQLIEDLFLQLQFIEITEYVKETGISDKTIRNRIESGKLPIKTLGKTNYIIKPLV